MIDQICKADEYFENEEGSKLIDKYVIITKAQKEINTNLKEEAEKRNVKIIFDKELKQLLSKMAKAYLGETVSE